MRYIDRRALREKRILARELRQRSTPEEKTLWHHLRTNQLGKHFRRQHVLAGFIVDFYCHSARLVIELDGEHHHRQREADHERDAVLSSLGNTIIRIPNLAVRDDLKAVLLRIEAELLKEPPAVPPSPFRGRGPGG